MASLIAIMCRLGNSNCDKFVHRSVMLPVSRTYCRYCLNAEVDELQSGGQLLCAGIVNMSRSVPRGRLSWLPVSF